MPVALESIAKDDDTRADCMNPDNRIAARDVFETRISIRFCRGSQKFATQGWARDLSESGLGALVAENLGNGRTGHTSNSDRSLWKRSDRSEGVSPGGNAMWDSNLPHSARNNGLRSGRR
jgi:hypothetical protein